MFNTHIKFEMSTITCNEEMKGNAKCKNFCFEPPWGIRVTHRVHLWLDGKRVVDFLLAIIELFSLALMTVALFSEMSKSAFFEGMGHFERKLVVDGYVARSPSVDR